MSNIDQLTDSAELRELLESVSEVTMPGPPSLEVIKRRGRAGRRRRLSQAAGLSATGIVAAVVLAVGLTGLTDRGSSTATIRTAAYTLRHNANGTDTLTLNPVELFNPSQLQSDLAQYGIPAMVTSGSYCTTTPEPAGFSQVVSGPGPGTWQQGSGPQPSITIDPSQMPSGTELSVGVFQTPAPQNPDELQADMDLIDTSSYTCTSTPPTLGPDTPGLGVAYGGRGTAAS